MRIMANNAAPNLNGPVDNLLRALECMTPETELFPGRQERFAAVKCAASTVAHVARTLERGVNSKGPRAFFLDIGTGTSDDRNYGKCEYHSRHLWGDQLMSGIKTHQAPLF